MTDYLESAACSCERNALLEQGRQFIRARFDYVRDAKCLPSMMMACIAEGTFKRDDIIRIVPRFVGHSYAEVAATLDHYTGPAADKHYWYRDEDKIYRLHGSMADHAATGLVKPPVPRRRSRQAQVDQPF